MRALVPALLALLGLTGCDSRHPLSEADRRKYYGDPFIYQGAPFCCIHVGLETNETALFYTNFWRFADHYDIRRPKKHYRAYSGPPLVTCKSEHVSVYVCCTETANIVARDERHSGPIDTEEADWPDAFWGEAYWPTNGSRITEHGHVVVAPITGRVFMASNDTNYPVQDFKRLSDALSAALRSAFPDRTIGGFCYYGNLK